MAATESTSKRRQEVLHVQVPNYKSTHGKLLLLLMGIGVMPLALKLSNPTSIGRIQGFRDSLSFILSPGDGGRGVGDWCVSLFIHAGVFTPRPLPSPVLS